MKKETKKEPYHALIEASNNLEELLGVLAKRDAADDEQLEMLYAKIEKIEARKRERKTDKIYLSTALKEIAVTLEEHKPF